MSFNSLPSELQLLIITEAVRADPAAGSGSSFSFSPCRNFDMQQALDLAPVSSACRSIIAGLLYSTVRITRPSMLKKFAVTLKERPDLAKLVQSLHLGPDSQLPRQGDPENQLRCQGWPIQLDDLVAECPLVYVETTLGEKDEEKLPRWCRPGRNFSISVPFKTCAGCAVGRAIDTVIAAIDVELRRRGYSETGRRIGLRAWAARLFMLQGCLDMYLMEMRRREDERGSDAVTWQRLEEMESTNRYPEVPSDCEYGRCGHYPQLHYRGASWGHRDAVEGEGETSNLQNNCYIITTEELWQHIARSDGPVNHFDHVLLYANSTRQGLEVGTQWKWKRVKAKLAGPHHDLLTNQEWEDINGVDKDTAARRDKRGQERRKRWREDRAYERELRAQAAGSDDDDEEEGNSEEEDEDEEDDAMEDYFYEQDLDDRSSASAESEEDGWGYEDLKHAVPRVAELIEDGRTVLASSHNITNLSLTGFFHRALTSLGSPDKLVSLNLGPLAEYWSHGLPNAEKLVALKKLRICGNMSTEDAAGIASCMPRLERLQWELTDPSSAWMR